jgi:hypothetical protein
MSAARVKRISLHEHDRIVAVVPESCAGPGWANSPLWVHIVNSNLGTHRLECLQPDEQPEVARLLFRALEVLHTQVLHSVQMRGTRRRG